MSETEKQGAEVKPFGPRLVDPGAAGWASEPKGLTQAERLLYGDLAGAVRRLGEAAAASEDAYSLICKHSVEAEQMAGTSDASREEEAFYREMVQVAWQLHENARATYAEVAAKAIARTRKRHEANEAKIALAPTAESVEAKAPAA